VYIYTHTHTYTGEGKKVKFDVEQAMKAQRGSNGVTLLILYPRERDPVPIT
jgi:hypothetical protein